MNIYKEAAALESENRAFAIAMITEAKGSTPRSKARMLVRDDGTTVGTIGGGPAEIFVIEQSLEAIQEGKSRSCHYGLREDLGGSMICGGALDFFIDVQTPGAALLLIGAGHVNQAVARLAARTGFSVTVADDRETLLQKEYFPPNSKLVYGETLAQAIEKISINEHTFILVATGNEDKEGLRCTLRQRVPYLAMLGSKRKVATLKRDLAAEGYSREELDRVISPSGLDIGAETPDEIAVSLVSQMLMIRSGKSGRSLYDKSRQIIVVRGAGDIASGAIARLHRSGYKVLALETEQPTVIRRTVAFADAVRKGEMTVEGLKARRASSADEVRLILGEEDIAVAVDPDGTLIEEMRPAAVIDAILAKKNLGTRRSMAPVTIALGPGFTAGEDVHYVIETMRGHRLGQIIEKGPASPDTKIPGNIEGYTEERLLRAPADGEVKVIKDISSLVTRGETVAVVGGVELPATLTGMIRGMILDGTVVKKGMKMGDVDPRGERANFTEISDKSYAIGGSVLEILLREGICP